MAQRITGFQEWTLGDDGPVVESRGSYEDEYDRQLEQGARHVAASALRRT